MACHRWRLTILLFSGVSLYYNEISAQTKGAKASSVAAASNRRAREQDAPATKKIVLIAGKKSHGPEGNGIHDYPWSVKLLKVMLDNSNVAEKVRVEYHLDGWPEDEKTLDDADTIMVISDGRDGDLYEEAPHFRTEDHRKTIAKQIARGCGFLTFHFSTFAPDQFAEDILSWSGGYFDWETDGKKQWYSAIKTLDAPVELATPDHPVLHGVEPFKLREEFYYNIRFADEDKSLKPLWEVPALAGRAEQGNVVAWAKERPDGGRGFGTTCGHFYDNWQQANFRKMILNSLVWTAKADVPEKGVDARYYTHAEVTGALAGKQGSERATVDDRPIRALILTGHQYPGHLWKDTTPVLKDALSTDPRIKVDVSETIEDLATEKITGYDLLVLNYCNWEKPGLSDDAKAGFVKYLQDGGGLILIHFANGAFHFSLPKAGESDWPEYRKICRRVWDHTPNKSGHDAFGKFVVDIAKDDHPVTKGMEPFETTDELYFRQQGTEPIEVLLTAKSKVTGQDEPMAFVYQYGKGRVMQTVLGHAAESLRTPGAAQLIRQSAAWVAQREPSLAVSQLQEAAKPQAEKLVEGKFGKALNAASGGLTVTGHESFRQFPLTVECWAKLANKSSYNILVAQENKNSATHWELFTMAGNGRLTAYLPGMKPDHVYSAAEIVDDQWHFLTMICEPKRVRLFVDGKQVADQAVEFQNGKTEPSGLAIGQLVDKAIGCAGLIDDVRISRGVREIASVPEKPLPADDTTLGLWRFDELDDQGRSPDASSHQRPAAVSTLEKKSPTNHARYHWSKEVVGFDWTEKDSVDNRWNQTDVGPFLASIVPMPGQPPVTKGLSIKVGDNASVCYDTQTMALRSIWTGGFLKFDPARYGIISSPQMDGDVQFLSSPDAGWVAKSVKYLGHTFDRYLTLKAEVDGASIQEVFLFRNDDGGSTLFRRIYLEESHPELRMRVGRFPGVDAPRRIGFWSVVSLKSGDEIVRALLHRNGPARWMISPDDVQLVIDESDNIKPSSFDLVFAVGRSGTDESIANLLSDESDDVLMELLAGGPRPKHHLIQAHTAGRLGTEAGPYQVDTLTIPFENKSKALFFVTGHDFFSNGDLAVCTVHGDVWRVSGVDRELSRLQWHRIATGLFQPLGLKVIRDEIYVLGRDRITKLRDPNLHGEMTTYENFCDLYETSPGGHDYIACLETDPEGNFYFVHARHGVQKISKDGKTLETIATGLRNPNGLSVSPAGEITTAPQEGNWTPASAIFMVRTGDHFGYGGPKITPARPLGYDPPLCWMPRLVDNSSAGQCWTPDDSWGLPKNSLLHFSFGQCTSLLTLREQVDGVWQGGVIPMPWKFQSGVSRGRFSPHDGQLYVSGLKGWVTSAVQDGCLHRVRYVGGDVAWPVKVESYQNGIAMTFGGRLDKSSAEDPDNYSVQACNYRYTQTYGSPDVRPSHPTVEGRDNWDVASATLLEDQRTVFLELPEITPVMQIVINWSIRADDQSPLTNSYNGTIHRLPSRSLDVPESSRIPRPGRLTREEESALAPGVLFTLQQADRTERHSARLLACQFAAPAVFLAEGYIKAPISGNYRFRVEGTATATLHINDRVVTASEPIRLHKGQNKVVLTAQRTTNGPTSLRLLWQSETFAEEPVPPTVWFHDRNSVITKSEQQQARGRELFETFQCVRCHQAATSDGEKPREFRAPILQDLHGRMTASWLTAWLMNPRAIRHGAEMPRLFDDVRPEERQAAADVAAYLLQGGELASESRELPEEQGDVLYEEFGCIACHRFTPPSENDAWSRDSLHFTAEKFPGRSLSRYLQQPQRHHPFTRMPDFRLSESEVDSLASFVTTHSTGRLKPAKELATADPERGQRHFAERRCGQCHGPADAPASPMKHVSWPEAAEAWTRGCLAESRTAGGKSPRFPLNEADRDALRNLLQTTQGATQPVSTAEQAAYLLKRLNCTACHHRDHALSPLNEILAEESDRGLPPAALPNLTFAGEKLHVDWMKQLFRGELRQKTRPWLTARMPAFPAYAEDLAAGLAAEHGYPAEPEASATVDDHLAGIGRTLTLKDNGLDCRQCHAVAGQQPTGDDKTKIAPGIDLAEIKQRLRADFYRRFVLDPPRFEVTVRMPKLSLDGKTTQATSLFDGDAARQFDAIWHYIQSLPE